MISSLLITLLGETNWALTWVGLRLLVLALLVGVWWKFGFPVFYITDLLQIAEALGSLGHGHDSRLANTLVLKVKSCSIKRVDRYLAI
ncbi:MAG: hypothetical protein DYG89_02670 [Caldilinea sp. CFX5]|nr:hypothetical protein [Caldilinea sp. CFX5]